MWPKTPTGCVLTIVGIIAIIAVLGGAFGWFADLLIDPGSKVPTPDQIDIPGVK